MEWVNTHTYSSDNQSSQKKVLAVDTLVDGRIVFGCSDGRMHIWNFKTNKGIRWVAHKGYVGCLIGVIFGKNIFEKNSNMIASGSYDGIIKLWNTEGRIKKILDFYPKDFIISSLAYSGQLLVSGHRYRKNSFKFKKFRVNLWNIETGSYTSYEFDGALNTHSLATDQSYIYMGLTGFGKDQKPNSSIAVWDTTNSTLRKLNGHSDYVTCVDTLYPDKIVSGSNDKTVKVWKKTGNWWSCEQTLTGHSSHVHCLEAIGDSVVSASVDGVVKLWNLSTGDVQTFKVDSQRVYSVRYMYLHHDTRHIITGSKKGVQVWFYKYPHVPIVKLGYKTFPSGTRLFTLITSETFDRTRDLAFFGKHLGLNVRATLHNTGESDYVWLHVFNTTGPLRMLTAPKHWRQAIYGTAYITLAEVERRLTKYCQQNGYDGWHMRVKMDNRVSNVKEAEYETVVLKSSFDKLQFRGKKRITLEDLKDKDHVRVSNKGKITFVKRIERLEEMFENLRF